MIKYKANNLLTQNFLNKSFTRFKFSSISDQNTGSRQNNIGTENTLLHKLISYRNSIFTSIFSIGLAYNGYYFFSLVAAGLTVYQASSSSKNLKSNMENFVDEKFTTIHNNKVLYAVEDIKKYICYHPELKRYFPHSSTNFRCTTYCGYRHNHIGAAYRHEENLANKRWNVSSEVVNLADDCYAKYECLVLFHNPTHFVIEYLRVDVYKPVFKKITIIDGRKDMKDWVEDIEDDKIDKRVYPKYRPDDNVKY